MESKGKWKNVFTEYTNFLLRYFAVNRSLTWSSKLIKYFLHSFQKITIFPNATKYKSLQYS